MANEIYKINVNGTDYPVRDTSKAPLASPAFTGTPTAPTAASGTNNTQVATTAFVTSSLTNAAYTIDTSNNSLVLNLASGVDESTHTINLG